MQNLQISCTRLPLTALLFWLFVAPVAGQIPAVPATKPGPASSSAMKDADVLLRDAGPFSLDRPKNLLAECYYHEAPSQLLREVWQRGFPNCGEEFNPAWPRPTRLVIANYLKAEPFRRGYAIVKADSGETLVDRYGVFVLPHRYHSMEYHPRCGYYRVNGTANGNYSGIFFPRTRVFTGLRFLTLNGINDTLIWASSFIGTSGKFKTGMVNDRGETVAPFDFDNTLFWEGRSVQTRDRHYGYIDWAGRWVIKPVFGYANRFVDGLAWVTVLDTVRNDYISGFIRRDGSWAIPPNDSMHPYKDASHGLIVTTDGKFKKFGLIDTTGRTIFPAIWPELRILSPQLIAFLENKRWGLARTDGSILAPAQYERVDVEVLADSFLVIVKDKRKGVINLRNSSVLIEPVYDGLGNLHDGRRLVRQGQRWGFIDWQGRTVVPLRYDAALRYENGYGQVIRGDTLEVIDTAGRVVYTTLAPPLHAVAVAEGWITDISACGTKWTDLATGRTFYADPDVFAEAFSEGRAVFVDRRTGRFGYLEIPAELPKDDRPKPDATLPGKSKTQKKKSPGSGD